MRLRRIGLLAAALTLFASLGHGGVASAQAPDAAAVARGDALLSKLGCAACHGAPGAGRRKTAGDLAQSPVGQMRDGGEALYSFMTNKLGGHPDGARTTGTPSIAQVTRAQSADILAAVQAQYVEVRAERGRNEAPAIIAAAGLACRISDALYILRSVDKAARSTTDAYEVACDGAVGRLVLKTVIAGQARYDVQDCISTSAPTAEGRRNNLTCVLPANRISSAQFAAYIEKTGVPCELKQARAFGATADAAYFEAACAGDRGYVVGVPLAFDGSKGPTARNCLAFEPGASTECRLTARDAMLASATAPLLARADSPCAVTGLRYVTGAMGDAYYEVACASGAGFMVVADARGGFKSKVACANAEGIAGGCTLSDVKSPQTADTALYTRRAQAGGYDCAVSGYRVIAMTPEAETVELACANRPDCALAQWPPSGPARIFNCAAAETTGYRCGLTKAEAAYPSLTSAIRKVRPTSTCQVSASNFLGVTADGGFVEVACADRAPGYVLQYAKATAAVTDALYCSRLRATQGVTCALPTNASDASK